MPDRVALIVAVDSYQDPSLKSLRSPTQDAKELEEVLGNPEIGSFSVTSLTNKPMADVMEAVERFFAHRAPEDLLLLYFSCHGLKDVAGRLYLAASNTKPALLASTGLSSVFVNEQMERSRSRRILVMLDCCYSGAIAKGFATKSDTTVRADQEFQGLGRVVLTASTAMEYAFEGTQFKELEPQPSVFTSAVVDGLRTGDADLDSDGIISVDELYQYVYDKVRTVTSDQTPSKFSNVQGGLYIATSGRTATPRIGEAADPFVERSSDLSWQREEATLELRRLTEDADRSIAAAAKKALEQLTADHDQLVRASALAALGDVARASIERARILAHRGDTDGAISELSRITGATDSRVQSVIHFNLGVLLTRAGKQADAREHLQAAIDLKDEVTAPRAAFNLGVLLEEMDQLDDAAKAYQIAVSYADADVTPGAAFNLGDICERLGRKAEAAAAFDTVTQYPDYRLSGEAVGRLGRLMQHLTAVEALSQVLRSAGFTDPDGAAWMQMAEGYGDWRKDFRLAQYAYEKALEVGGPETRSRASEGIARLAAQRREARRDAALSPVRWVSSLPDRARTRHGATRRNRDVKVQAQNLMRRLRRRIRHESTGLADDRRPYGTDQGLEKMQEEGAHGLTGERSSPRDYPSASRRYGSPLRSVEGDELGLRDYPEQTRRYGERMHEIARDDLDVRDYPRPWITDRKRGRELGVGDSTLSNYPTTERSRSEHSDNRAAADPRDATKKE